jgi:hypothetical protein
MRLATLASSVTMFLGTLGALPASALDLEGYVVETRPFSASSCAGILASNKWCIVVNRRWDDRRRQHINWFYDLDAQTGHLRVLHRLHNEEYEGDHVAFTARWLDASGKDLFVFHETWGINARDSRTQEFDFDLPPQVWQNATSLWTGFKVVQGRDDAAIGRPIINMMIDAVEGACVAYTGEAAGCAAAAEAIREEADSG